MRLARAEPLLLARGRLERYEQRGGPIAWGGRERGGEQPEEIRPLINVVVRELASLSSFIADAEAAEGQAGARVHRLAPAQAAPGAGAEGAGEQQGEPAGEEIAASMRASAPAVQSFAMGRRR